MLDSFFSPNSVAVIGASREPAKVGHQILKNLLGYKKGKVFPVNPLARSILSTPVFQSLSSIPGEVELAIIAIPAPVVHSVIDECIEKKVKAVVIITAGFAEMSKQGKKAQEEIVEKLRSHDIQLLGPNSLGFLFPRNNLNASFADQKIEAGSIALISQSGAMLTALFTEMESNHVGCSVAISLGNKAGISEVEILEWAGKDSDTKTIGLYLESFTDLPKFFALSSQISKQKPIIVLKGGRSKRGQSASVSHTAALATNDELLKAAAQQAGFVMVDTVEEFMQTVFFLEQYKTQPENTMIITNAGGPGVNTVDVGEMKKLGLAKWANSSIERIQEEYPQIHVANPLDVIGDATAERFEFAIAQAQRDQNIDSILVIITQQAVTNIPQIIKMLLNIKGKKPVCVALIGGERFAKERQKLNDAGIFTTEYPNEVVDVFAIVQRTAQAKYISEKFEPAPIKIDTSEHATTMYSTSIDLTFQLLGKYGLKTPIYSVITYQDFTQNVHLPSYAKTANLSLAHKKDIGAVYGIVNTREDVKKSYAQLKKFGNAVLYQEIIQADLELLMGANRDPQFGLYLAIGLGGSWTNVLSDRAYAFLPTSRKVLRKKLQQTKAFEALQKLSKEYDQDVLGEVLTTMSSLQKLMREHPEIQELEINPLMINKKGIWVADVKVKT